MTISNEQINNAWGNSNFGIKPEQRRDYLLNAIMKFAMGYHNGYTITTIAKELGLIDRNCLPSKKGRDFLKELYNKLEFKP